MSDEKPTCPPHDFGQDEGIDLLEALKRTCPKCGVAAAEVLGKMIKGYPDERED